MKSLLIFCVLASNAFADDAILNSKAGLIANGLNGQISINKAYSFPVKKLHDQLCKSGGGYKVTCEWKDGNLHRTEVNVAGKKAEDVIVFEKRDNVYYVTNWFMDGEDAGLRALMEMSKLMSRLEAQNKK